MGRRPASLKVRALQWLAQREHSPTELRAKLLRAAMGRPVPPVADEAPVPPGDLPDGAADSGDDPDEGRRSRQASPALVAEVDALIAWLTAHQYLSVERFVESRIHARQARYGNQRISQELQQHGLQLEPDARQALKESELARARELWVRKFGSPAADPAARIRQMRFLAGRGFSHEVVRRVVRSAPGDADD